MSVQRKQSKLATDKPPSGQFDQSSTTKKSSPNLIALVVLLYFVISLSVVFLNKIILSSAKYDFPYPLFVTWFQLLVALVLLIVCSEVGKWNPSISLIPPYEFDPAIAIRIAPLTAIYVLMLVFNNLCLKYVEVTFYQVARSLSINFTILFTYIILGQKTSPSALLACLIVFLGFAIDSLGEINFSWSGIIYGVGSSAFVALYGIYVKKSLPIVAYNEYKLLHYNTTVAIILLGSILLCSNEVGAIWQNLAAYNNSKFWTLMVLTGITGFGINISVFLQVKFTSPLTNTISGTAKSCLQTLLATLIFQNTITTTNAIGIFLAIFGSSYYSYIRYREMISK
ncbi:triose-phosphate transporter family-domain-containing protein [Umbelopsis sp. AD052]|nr:triose-phosphate transporter family-domain-containing protein [Umbelopsis sp. AD052]